MAGNIATKSDGRYKPPVAAEKQATPSYDKGVAATCTTTISVEFVAKPNESHRVHSLVPGAITSTLESVTGFAGRR